MRLFLDNVSILVDVNCTNILSHKEYFEQNFHSKVIFYSNFSKLLNSLLINKPNLVVFDESLILKEGIKVGSFKKNLELNEIDYMDLRDCRFS